jgi:lipopolysaccharide biosynthesis glycosyltransferase
MPLKDKPMAAVPEHRLSCADHAYTFGEYFNSGVMLVDLERWRKADMIRRGREFAQANPEKLRHWDQDVLNHLFVGQWIPLEDRWNACPHLFGLNGDYDLNPDKLTDFERRAIDNPAIIHFAGPGSVKPWHYRCTHPLRNRYRFCSARTPWADVPLSDLPPPALVRAWKRSLFNLKCGVRSLLRPA